MHAACTGRCKAPWHWNSIFSTDLVFPLSEQTLPVENTYLDISRMFSIYSPVAFLLLSKLAIWALNEPVLEFGDQSNGLRTSWMSLKPVDWVGKMHNEKIVSVRFVKIGRFVTKWASTRIWGPVEWIEDQLNGLGTSWMGYNDQSIYMIQNNDVLYLTLCDFGTPNNFFLFNAFLQ